MLLQVSYYSREKEKAINDLVGKPFGWRQRFRMGGVGSQRMLVEEANPEIKELLSLHNLPPFTNIELRPKGIIFWFRILLDNYVLVLPYYKLSVFQNGNQLSVFADEWKVKLIPAHRAKLKTRFVQQMLELKATASTGSRHPDV